MNLPGFTAERSFYKPSKNYSRSVHTYNSERTQIVTPASFFFPWLGYWLLSGTIAKECLEENLLTKAASVCRSLAVQVAEDAGGQDCSADCTAYNVKSDSSCNVTSSGCNCHVTCR